MKIVLHITKNGEVFFKVPSYEGLYCLYVTPLMCFKHLRHQTLISGNHLPHRNIDEWEADRMFVCPHPGDMTREEACKVVEKEYTEGIPVNEQLLNKLDITDEEKKVINELII